MVVFAPFWGEGVVLGPETISGRKQFLIFFENTGCPKNIKIVIWSENTMA